jgi:hypothetical protein
MRRFSPLMTLAALAVTITLFPSQAAADEPSAGDSAGASARAAEFVAYYFHGNVRCATCRKLEAYSGEAIAGGFPAELASGRLAWRVVNTDEPENAHFVNDFELVSKSLVLVEYHDGEVTRFQNLTLIWQLVRDKDGFIKYVRDATREFLGPS